MPQHPGDEFGRDAMLGCLLRCAAEVSHEHLDLLCEAAEFWSDEDAAERLIPLRVVGPRKPNADDPAA